MLLKKQTVWLLTMLSLVVVLSVYYVTSEPKQSDMAAVESKDGKEATKSKETSKKASNKSVVTESADDQVFEQIRLQINDARSKLREDLTTKAASTDLSADERSQALDEMKKLTEIAQTEKVLENLIKSKGYEDVLVNADGDEMKITVKAKDHDKKAANQIVRLVTEQLGNLQNVAVNFQP
ncbi:SpoIIIAH-like family protein [Heyndrickxia vini]|uniref:SpoIIIAH-like family protein n=1 Tax=Heyndrickxia vini TaxID=1476025 RepID=A0ABX7E6H2_9BACI|nr:SpoIIIAH-like family protein [Heyndrickxia vini]QQZ10894.1 SpoIIIAH-like family protein [Heyndrickxia vini]